MRLRPRRALWLTPLLVIVACKQPPDLSAEIEEFASLINRSRTAICMCPQDYGYPSLMECSDALGRVSVDDEECMRERLVGYEEEGEVYLECVLDAYMEYVGCLESNVNCEEGAIDACDAAHAERLDACPQLPSGVHQSFGACYV